MNPPAAPPGWYPESGRMRWWDGTEWGPPAPGALPPETVNRRIEGMIAHMGVLGMWFIPPLALRIARRRDPYVRHHATEALNFQILFGVVWNAALLPGYLQTTPGNGFPRSLAIGLPVALLALAANIGFSLRGAILARRGVWWRYPLNVRLVPGALGKHEVPPTEGRDR